jgi:hypothetical protein
LLRQASGTNDKAALEVTANDEFLNEQPGHDRLAGAGIIRQEKTQWLAGQHGIVHCCDLVRQRLDHRGMNRENGVEQIREADSMSF